ncbi:hypothetical protein CR513_21896, partial [Mucuna pruriens]
MDGVDLQYPDLKFIQLNRKFIGNLKPKEDSRPRGPGRDLLGKLADSATSQRKSTAYLTVVSRERLAETYMTQPTTQTKPKRTSVHPSP